MTTAVAPLETDPSEPLGGSPVVCPRATVEDEWEVVSTVSSISTAFTLVSTAAWWGLAADRAEEEDDDEDDRLSTVSVSTRHGFPALSASLAPEEEEARGGDPGDDAATASTAAPPARSFKDALLHGSGGVDSAKARALARAPGLLRRVARKPRKPRDDAAADAADPLDPLDDEFYGRKAHGSKRYRMRSPYAAARAESALRASGALGTSSMLPTLAEEAGDGSDDDDDDEGLDYFD